MSQEEVTIIFDIGKTNKKLFIYDEKLNEIFHHQENFDEVEDDDGYLGDDLNALSEWMKSSVRQIIENGKYQVKKINISAYGASMVHLDESGQIASPFYNYTKPLPDEFYDRFFKLVGDSDQFSVETASPMLGMLNSGFQLFYLKHYKPEIAKKVSVSLHFPQFLSYLFTGKMVSESTSIGCHTALWDFATMQYHSWVRNGGYESQLAPIVPTNQTYTIDLFGRQVEVGVGIHDSSSALIPYLISIKEPFNLLSTGTWSVSMNPYNNAPLTKDEFKRDCLNFISYAGKPVKASRLFMGEELKHQVMKISEYFNCDYERYLSIKVDPQFVDKRKTKKQLLFNYGFLKPHLFGYQLNESENLSIFQSFEEAYLQLIDELTDLQVMSLQLTIANSGVKCMYVDGGFASNEPFIQRLANKLPELKIFTNSSASGSAMGAALLANDQHEDQFTLKNCVRHLPFL
ncbi:MAG: FGGY family carbohydrate kinase [Bacteroidetes bacterium]|nr:FGGY family carbohydrate kinase [Bacteroidota bacterium]MDA1120312.1 FGGY family carbohydrate kinase [Bacteroidota bacterium]